MAKNKTFEITLNESKGAFSFFRKKGHSKEDYDFSSLSALRKVLSNEKARILNTIKDNPPSSIYALAKSLGRSFKPVLEDVTLLKRFGLIEIVEEKINNRIRHKPILIADTITINLKI